MVLSAVGADLHADVAEAVKLGAHLADLGGHELVVPDDLVASERSAGGVPGVRITNWRVPNSSILALVSWPSL